MLSRLYDTWSSNWTSRVSRSHSPSGWSERHNLSMVINWHYTSLRQMLERRLSSFAGDAAQYKCGNRVGILPYAIKKEKISLLRTFFPLSTLCKRFRREWKGAVIKHQRKSLSITDRAKALQVNDCDDLWAIELDNCVTRSINERDSDNYGDTHTRWLI